MAQPTQEARNCRIVVGINARSLLTLPTAPETAMSFKVALAHNHARLPLMAVPGSAGFDLYSAERVVVPPGNRALVEIGVIIDIPSDCYARIAPRSGLALQYGIDTLAGVVDSNYRNTLKVILQNHDSAPFFVEVGDRIAQLVFERIYVPETLQVVSFDDLSETARGEAGLGSSGR